MSNKFDALADSTGEGGISRSFADGLRAAKNKFHQQARAKVYYDNPDIWALEVLGFEAWSKQREIGRSIVEHPYTAVKSCHGAGKSAWAAVIVCWFVSTRIAAGENVFVITTAPSYAQVHLVLWEEIRRHHARAGLPGYITQGDAWKIDKGGRTIELAVGRKPSDTDENSFQGKHEDNLMIVLDEANGIPTTLYTGATVMLTGNMRRQKMLAIGNPDDPNSQFGQNDAKDKKLIAAGEKPFWNTVQIKAWDTPNFTDEKNHVSQKVRDSVLQLDWVEKRKVEWGTEDPRWVSKIEAEFPDVSEDSLFPVTLIAQSQANPPDPGYELTSKRIAVDVSRFGNDRTVVSLYDSGVVTILDSWTKKNTIETANRVHNLAIEHAVSEVRVDEGNSGGGVIDFLAAHQGYNYRVVAMNNSNRSPNPNRWLNARAYWYDNLKEQMRLNQVQLPVNPDLETELAAIKYKFVAKTGALQIEAKDEMKKRLNGRSPDYADAVVMVTADLSGLIPERGEDAPPLPGTTSVLETQFASLMGQWTVSPV